MFILYKSTHPWRQTFIQTRELARFGEQPELVIEIIEAEQKSGIQFSRGAVLRLLIVTNV